MKHPFDIARLGVEPWCRKYVASQLGHGGWIHVGDKDNNSGYIWRRLSSGLLYVIPSWGHYTDGNTQVFDVSDLSQYTVKQAVKMLRLILYISDGHKEVFCFCVLLFTFHVWRAHWYKDVRSWPKAC